MDPQVKALLDMMAAQAAANPGPRMHEIPAATARANADAGFAAFNMGAPEVGAVADREVPGPAGPIPVRVYSPPGSGPFPLLVYYHGGGWTIGNRDTHDKLCRELCLGSGSTVASIDYRLAPEHPAPAPLEDCLAATRWLVANASEFGADGSRFAVGGDSAGANLAACVTQALRDEGHPLPRLQLLLYGAFEDDQTYSSYQRNGEGKILTTETMAWFWDNYLCGGADPASPSVCPPRGNLEGLPPVHLIVGSFDPLLDESVNFAAKLAAAHVRVTLSVYPYQPHIFLQLSGFLDGGKQGVAEASAALKAALA